MIIIANDIGENRVVDAIKLVRGSILIIAADILCQGIASQSHESLYDKSNNCCVHGILWKQYVTLSQRNRESRVMGVATIN